MADGVILSQRDAQRIQAMLRDWEHSTDPATYRRRGGISGEGGTNIKIFEVQSAATGDGVYNCYEQTLDKTEWAGTSGNPKFDDKDAVSVEVLNLNEYDPAAGQHSLVTGSMLAAWQMTDDEGNSRWIGVVIIPWKICT